MRLSPWATSSPCLLAIGRRWLVLRPRASPCTREFAIHGLADPHTGPRAHTEGVDHPNPDDVIYPPSTELALRHRAEVDVRTELQIGIECGAKFVHQETQFFDAVDGVDNPLAGEHGQASIAEVLHDPPTVSSDGRGCCSVEAIDETSDGERIHTSDRVREPGQINHEGHKLALAKRH